MRQEASTATKQVVGKEQSIPFRTDSVVATSDLLGILMLTVAMLGVVVAGLYWAKKKGMIPAWLKNQASPGKEVTLKKLESLRISPSTVLHRVSDEGKIYLLAESTRNISLTATDGIAPELKSEK